MADLTTSTKISESSREVVFAFQYQYVDTGDESAVLKIDVSGLTADADTDIIIMHLDEGQSGYQDFSKFGGLPTSSSFGANGTGDIKFTTTGAGAAGDAYQIIIRGIKQY